MSNFGSEIMFIEKMIETYKNWGFLMMLIAEVVILWNFYLVQVTCFDFL